MSRELETNLLLEGTLPTEFGTLKNLSRVYAHAAGSLPAAKPPAPMP